VHSAVRSRATVRDANRIGRRMAGNRANVNGFLIGRNNGEGQPILAPIASVMARDSTEGTTVRPMSIPTATTRRCSGSTRDSVHRARSSAPQETARTRESA